MSGEELDKRESQRATNILTFTTTLEHIGDILGDLMTSNEKKIASDLEFSDEGFEEIQAMHMNVLRDLKRIHSHIVAIAYPVLEQRKKKK